MLSQLRFTADCKKDCCQSLHLTLAEKNSIMAEDINLYADFRYFVPSTMEEGQTQLEIAILLFNQLMVYKGIASRACCYARSIMHSYLSNIFQIQFRDKLLTAKFIKLADLVFDTFCNKLAQYRSSYDLIHNPKQELEYYVDKALNWRTYFKLDYSTHLPLPNRICLKNTVQANNKKNLPKNDSKHDLVW